YFNKMLLYSFYAYGEANYKAGFNSIIAAYFQELLWIMELQNTAWVSPCIHSKLTDKKDSASFEPYCPMRIIVGIGPVKFKLDCETLEIEGGEGIVGSLEMDLSSGEFTVGVGAGLTLAAGPFDAGVSEKFIFSFDSQHNLCDFGLKMEAGVEAEAGPLSFERTISGTLTVESGIEAAATDIITGKENEIEFAP
ncbi:MAG: hypothetical protein JST39_25330, partial [Bacteroidetes bacterium]|nr:hypothetical protein [Bacteroidota bacterium]